MDRTYSLSEYLFWRGDLSFSASGEKDRTSVPTAPFSEVDGLILSAMSYADFRGVDGEHVLPFPAAGIALSPGQLTEDGRKILKTDVQQFAEQLYRTRRFSELSLTGVRQRNRRVGGTAVCRHDVPASRQKPCGRIPRDR